MSASKVRVDVEERRQKIYEFNMMGWNTVQIARSLGVDDSNVSRALSVMRTRNASWFDQHKDPDRRFRSLFKQIYDHFALTIREAWVNYHHTSAEKPEARNNLLARVQHGLNLQAKLLGIAGPDLDDLFYQDVKNGLDRQLAEVERDIQDFVLVRKVQPLGPGVTMVPGNNK